MKGQEIGRERRKQLLFYLVGKEMVRPVYTCMRCTCLHHWHQHLKVRFIDLRKQISEHKRS